MQRNLVRFLVAASIATSASMVGCGRSAYSPAAKKDTEEALREEAIIALNDDDYDTAAEKLSELWADRKDNETAQLYSIALLGTAGFSLFDIVKRALTSITDTSSKESNAGNAILDKLTSIVGSDVTDAQLSKMLSAVEILEDAPDQKSSGLKFQKCLTAGIYTAPTLTGLTTAVTELTTTLQELPTRLSASGSSCSASATDVSAVGEELTDVISNAATLATRIKDVEDIMGDCLPEGTGSDVNTITSKVTALAEKADKGCTIPATQAIGTYTLPSCMNDFVLAAGGSTAAAGDGKIAGCEVFLNCSGGQSCF